MKLPSVKARPQGSARPSQAVSRVTDLGLGQVAQSLEGWAAEVEQTKAIELEVDRGEAEQNIRPIADQLRSEVEAEFATAGAEYDGTEPGFARTMNNRLTERLQGFGDDLPLTSTERDALTRDANQYRDSVAQRAIAFESQKRGAMVAEGVAAREAVESGGRMAAYMARMAEGRQALDQSYDGSQPDYAGQVIALHDTAAAEIIAAAPEAARPRLTQQLASQRLQLLGSAMDVEQRGEQAYVVGQARSAFDQTLNSVLTAPSMYETAVAGLDPLLAGLPANARPAERARMLDGLTDAYVGALIRDGKADQAVTLLNGGSLDTRLQPGTKARLLELAVRKSEEPDATDILAALQAKSAMDDNLASIAATGQAIPGADPATLANALSPTELARYAMDIETARRVHASTPGFGGMTEGEIATHVAGLEPQPGAPGYAEAQQRYTLAQQAAARELKAREDDPAAWGLATAPNLGAALAGLGSGDLRSRQRAAATYATAQMTLQAEAGIPLNERRVLSRTAATEIVERAEGDADPANGLRGLAAVLEGFEPPAGSSADQLRDGFANRNRVIAELKAAGADEGDIAAALDLGNDQVRLGRYVAATRGAAYEALRDKDKTDLNEAVDGALRPYLASFAGVPASRELTAGRRIMAQRLAAERLATRGGSERDAAREAAEVVAGGYDFVGPNGWRMPAAMAARRDPESGALQSRTAEVGASRLLGALSVNEGSGLYTPADNGRGLNADQRRRRYADTVRTAGRWFTSADDSGLVMMTPTLDGGWTPALQADGRPIAYNWGQLVNAGRARAAQGQRGGGLASADRQPRGIRNNNPGNIEFRPTNAWRGQTGSDGRFATFATPEAGIRALAIDVGTKYSRGLNSVQAIISAYAPPSENDTTAYVARIARQLGVAPTARIDVNDPRIRAALVSAIISHENGMQPYSAETIGRIAREATRR